MSLASGFRAMWLVIFTVGCAVAQAQQQAASVHGLVTDPDSAVIPGATVTLTQGAGKATILQSGSDGTYTFKAVPAGTYSLTISMSGFGSFVREGLVLRPGQNLALDAKMTIQQQEQTVVVTTNANAVSVDQDSNASATVIKGKDLDALSDDPDELSSELSALAGPAAGPNGGQIYVDGFTGGALPPKSSIREIRVNQNPFSAQFERLGYGRVEVFTKPGTDKLHGSLQLNGNDSSFNTVTPLVARGTSQPYHTIFFLGNVTGPLSSSASYSVSASHRSIQDNTLFNGLIYSTNSSLTGLCAPGATVGCSVVNPFAVTTSFPQTRTDVDPRLDFALGEKNTLTTRLQISTNSSTNDGVGNLDLPSTGYNQSSSEYELQVSDTQILSPRVINETRLELGRNRDAQSPQSNAPTVNVQGAFVSGGSSGGNSSDHQERVELQNYTSVQLAKNFIRAGGRLRLNREATFSAANSNGTFTYDSLANYNLNQPKQFSVTRNNVGIRTTFADVGLYLEDDWKARPNLTLSYGFRYEAQNHLGGHHDFAPRVSFAYGVGSAKGNPKTVLRGGFGMFYDYYGRYNYLNTLRQNGVNQVNTLVQGPFIGVCSPTDESGCTTGGLAAGNNVFYFQDPRLRRPYTMQFALGADQQLFKGANMSMNYLHAQGVHQLYSVNLTPGQSVTTKQYESEGAFKQDQLIVNFNFRGATWYSLFGYYTLNFARANTNGAGSFPTQSGNLNADYGRAGFSTRNRMFLGGNVTLPHRVSLSPFIVAQSGTPYNITTGTDNNGDRIFNDRPSFANGTSGNCLDATTFTDPRRPNPTNANEIPVNYCTGPALFTTNVRVSKTWGFGPETGSGQRGSGGGSGPGGMGRGGPGGGGDHGHGGPMGGPGGANTGRRYNVSLSAQFMNLFNTSDLGTPSGILGSPTFGRSTTLAGNIYTSNSAVRRIYLQAGFNF